MAETRDKTPRLRPSAVGKKTRAKKSSIYRLIDSYNYWYRYPYR
jgi:hypothetical protein